MGGGHLNACPGRIEAYLWNNIEARPRGGWNKIQACPGDIYKDCPKGGGGGGGG